MNFWFFKTGVQKPPEEWARPGKVEWPDHVTVRMNKREAIRHLASLARQLESNLEGEEFELHLVGKQEPYPKD